MPTADGYNVLAKRTASAVLGLSLALLCSTPAQCLSYAVFDVPGAESSDAYAINANGTVTGPYTNTGSNVPHGYMRDSLGNITTFDVKGATSGTAPNGINDHGAVVGSYGDAAGMHGFLRRPSGKILSIDVPGSASTVATAIGKSGSIAGYYSDGTGTHGFVRDPHGILTLFEMPGATSTTPYAISVNGSVSGA